MQQLESPAIVTKVIMLKGPEHHAIFRLHRPALLCMNLPSAKLEKKPSSLSPTSAVQAGCAGTMAVRNCRNPQQENGGQGGAAAVLSGLSPPRGQVRGMRSPHVRINTICPRDAILASVSGWWWWVYHKQHQSQPRGMMVKQPDPERGASLRILPFSM